MKGSRDLQFTLLAAVAHDRKRPDAGSDADQPQTDSEQSAQDNEPRLPEGYRPVRDAIPTLLMYMLMEKSIEATRHPGATKLATEDETTLTDPTLQ